MTPTAKYTLYTPKDFQRHALNPPDNGRPILAWNVNSRKYERAHYDRDLNKYIGESGKVIAIDVWWELKGC
jgi:hypothetical protein